jgi:hypothetical protein
LTDQKLNEKNTAEIFFISFLYKKLLFTYVQATGEAFSPQKRTSSTSKIKFINFFYVCGSFLPSCIRSRMHIANPDPDPGTPMNPEPIRIRIRIHNTDSIRVEKNFKTQGVGGGTPFSMAWLEAK